MATLKTLRNLKYVLAVFMSLSLFHLSICGEEINSLGYKYFKNYSYLEYDHSPQNWCIVQDSKGLIYVGNQGGLLVYDGVTWEVLYIPNVTVRSMAIGKDGHIYIGGSGEIGYLGTDSRGFLTYVSLLDKLDNKNKKFSIVWSTVAADDSIYFRTSNMLFRWDYNKIVPYRKGAFWSLFFCDGKLWSQHRDLGTGVFNNSNHTLITQPGCDVLKRKKIWMMTQSHSQNNSPNIILGTLKEGLWSYDGKKLKPFATTVNQYFIKNRISHGITLSTGDYAVATEKGGLVILDSRGKLKYIFDKTNGLQDNNVNYVFEDNGGNIWLALSRGISRLEYRSPFFHYNSLNGLEGIVISVVRHNNDIYAGTMFGIYVLRQGEKRFVLEANLNACFNLLSTGQSLLAATQNGVYRLDTPDNVPRKLYRYQTFKLVASRKFPNHTWCASRKGLAALVIENNRWKVEYTYEEIKEPVIDAIEAPAGHLWLINGRGDILKIDFPGDISKPQVKCYSQEVPRYEGNLHLTLAEGHVVFTSRKGIFRYDETKDTFIPDNILGQQFSNGPNALPVFRIAQGTDGTIWFNSKNRNYFATPGSQGKFAIDRGPFHRIPIIQMNTIYPDPWGKDVWFAGNEGMIRYTGTPVEKWNKDFSTVIQKVFINDTTPVYGIYRDNLKEPAPIPQFPYNNRNISFQCGALFFENESANTYRYKLDGYDNQWSEWTPETRKYYTNLDNGSYTFHVQARNIYKVTGEEDTFSFRVLPPWYKTWWAFVLYGLALLPILNFIGKWRTRKLVREKEKLEQVVEKRTLQLKEQSEKLKEMDRIKSRFFANISHEFRTPLTLIMSPLEQMLSQPPEPLQIKTYRLMMRNAQQLLTWINRLLELARIDSGRMKLHAARLDIVSFLSSTLSAFQGLAQQQQLTLDFLCREDQIPLYFDREKMEEVMYNLLSNALKFTPPGGRITVSISLESPGSTGSFVLVSVKDTGIGIPPQQLTHVFDRFFQAGQNKDKTGQGTGIGLSLTREIVLLHHGEIEVHSQEGEGTRFDVRFPVGKDHLSADEIVQVQDLKVPDQGEKIKKLAELHLEAEEDKEDNNIIRYTTDTGEENPDAEPGPEIISILVVEDHKDMRHHICGILEPHYNVIEARDGKEGIHKAKEFMPDLIVSDVMMPEVDGYHLCSQLKKEIKTSHIPIILLTARASEGSVIEGLETGADDYITKPFNEKMLMARIKNLIDLRRQMQLKIQRQKMLLPSEVTVSSQDEIFLKEFQAVIEKNLTDEEFNIEALCKKLLISRSTLFKKIQVLTGETPNQFIQSYRLERGAQLLRENYGNVTEVAMAVGFSSPQYFSKCFKEIFHQSPKAFQASELNTG